MYSQLNVTSIGYSHLRTQKPCQDFSSSYSDGDRTIITACDGHGGDVYVRSHKGSRFASIAAHNVFMDVDPLLFKKYAAEEIEHKLKLTILCEWNRLVRRDLVHHPLRKRELEHLGVKEIESLRQTPIRAYGSTLGAALRLGKYLFCVGLGDGGCFLMKDGNILSAFEESEDEPVANVTHSLCAEDAFSHMQAKLFEIRKYDGVLLCTDGILSPYCSIQNFNVAFAQPVMRRLLCGKTEEVKDFVRVLGWEKGVGDDVSLAVMWNRNAKVKFYE